jgi:Type I phosphodiesterase / nucleotide pyrophosphatase
VSPLPDPVRPAYGQASVAELAGGLWATMRAGEITEPLAGRPSTPDGGQARPGAPEGPGEIVADVVRGARSVVVLLLDGLGWNAIQQHAATLPTISSMTGRPITTVVPSTTATALTSFTTGLTPAEHGIMGYRFRAGGAKATSVFNSLAWAFPDKATTIPDPARFQRHGAFTFGARPVPVVHRSEFKTTGFTLAHLAGARHVGWRLPSGIPLHVSRLVAEGHPLVYAYYDGVDKIAHEYGLLDGFFAAELAAADALVDAVLASLPGDVAVVVTADHGQVHWGVEGWRELGDLWGYCTTCAGDARFRYLHAIDGAAAELLDAARERFGDVAWVFSREQLIDEGWLGPMPADAASHAWRIGDVVLAARAPVAFVDPGFTRERQLLAGHGSLTADEMLVPCLAARGTG